MREPEPGRVRPDSRFVPRQRSRRSLPGEVEVDVLERTAVRDVREGTLHDAAALVHDDDVVGEAFRLLEREGRDDNTRAALPLGLDEIPDVAASVRIEAGTRFVE